MRPGTGPGAVVSMLACRARPPRRLHAPGTFVRARRRRTHARPARRVGSGRSVVGAAHRGGAVGGGPGWWWPARSAARARARDRRPSPSPAVADACPPGPAGVGRGMVRGHRPPRLRRRRARRCGSSRSCRCWPGPCRRCPGVGCRRRAGGGGQRVGLRGRGPARRPGPARDRRRALARRAAWLVCLAPAAFTAGDGVRRRHAAGPHRGDHARPAGPGVVVGGGARPGGRARRARSGVLLVVPAAVEAMPRVARRPAGAERVARVAAVVGPRRRLRRLPRLGGLALRGRPGPAAGPAAGNARGGLADPLRTLAHDASLLVHGRHLGSAPASPVGAAGHRRCWSWPCGGGRSPTAPSPPPSSSVALTASNLDGFERYALSAFPLVLAGAGVTSGPAGGAGGAHPGRRRAGRSTPCWPSPTSTSRDLGP